MFPGDNGNDDPKTKHFIDILTKSIEQYKKHITRKKEVISALLKKEETEQLSMEEKNLLLSTQQDLYSLDKMRQCEVPEILKSVETLDRIKNARQEAEAYIKSLLEK